MLGHNAGLLNLSEITTREEVEMLAQEPLLVMAKDRRCHRQAQECPAIANADERRMAE
jgi:hypothetical protein